MNMSIVGLRHDLNHYAGIITQHSNQLVNVTHQINEIHRFIMVSPVFSPTSAVNESKYIFATKKILQIGTVRLVVVLGLITL